MARHPDYPGVSSYIDRHGKTRWRFVGKRGNKNINHEPHTDGFDTVYQALIEGQKSMATIIRMPGTIEPKSLDDAWRELRKTARWNKLDNVSKALYTRTIEPFLDHNPKGQGRVGDGPVADFRPRHVAAVLDGLADTPSKARLLYIVLKKMMRVAIVQEWIEFDPTYGAEFARSDSEGLKAWPPHFCAQFELAWPVGTTARTTYELARWLGTRRSDVALMRWDQLVTRVVKGKPVEGFEFVQFKGRRKKGAFAKFHPVSPMLAEALAPLSRETETVLARLDGKPYDMKSLSVFMWKSWAPKAGIPRGYSLHGLRKAMGGMLADAGATGHESKDVLGHDTWAEVDRYSKSRDQAAAATEGMRKVVKMVRPNDA